MKTRIFKIDDPARQREEIAAAAGILRAGGLVAFPTETVYGLGANGLDGGAVRRIFEAKGRPSDNPLILHVVGAGELERYCAEIPDSAFALAERFWPGPLTMVLKRRPIVPDETTAGLPSVAMRCPDHPVAQALLAAAGVPVAAPSGNLSGRPSPTRFSHILADMDGRIEGIVDGGDCAVGVESTIVDLTTNPPRLLRPGGVSLEALREVLGRVDVDEAVVGRIAADKKPKAPGMKYRHYAPRAPVTVVCGAPDETATYIRARVTEHDGVLCFDEYAASFPGITVRAMGASARAEDQARRLFDALRSFDDTAVDCIFAQCPSERGLGLAVSNRLKKAAGFHVVKV